MDANPQTSLRLLLPALVNLLHSFSILLEIAMVGQACSLNKGCLGSRHSLMTSRPRGTAGSRRVSSTCEVCRNGRGKRGAAVSRGRQAPVSMTTGETGQHSVCGACRTMQRTPTASGWGYTSYRKSIDGLSDAAGSEALQIGIPRQQILVNQAHLDIVGDLQVRWILDRKRFVGDADDDGAELLLPNAQDRHQHAGFRYLLGR